MVNEIRVLALDIDGVLTDGSTGLNDSSEDRRISFHDLDAVTKAQSTGLTVALVTGEDTPAVDEIARRFGIYRVKRGAKDKALALMALSTELGIPLEEFCYVGDSDRDASALSRVGFALTPLNATRAAKSVADRILSRPGGAGAVAEAVALLLCLREDASRGGTIEREMRRIVAESLAAHQRLLDDSLPMLAQMALALIRAIRSGHTVFLFGNGGSAADAQHVAAELVGRFAREREPWPAIALTTDTSILTAVSNDWDFADIFARQVRALARTADIIVGISTSGRSPNVLAGLKAGRERDAMTIGFTGQEGGTIMEFTDLCFCAPAQQTPRIQELHLLAWHTICELVEEELARPT